MALDLEPIFTKSAAALCNPGPRQGEPGVQRRRKPAPTAAPPRNPAPGALRSGAGSEAVPPTPLHLDLLSLYSARGPTLSYKRSLQSSA